MKHIKKLALPMFLALAASLTLGSFAGVMQSSAPPADLPAGTLIYFEDFENAKGDDTDSTLRSLGWTKEEGLRDFTAIFTIEDGHLHIDNLDETVGESQDSYAGIMSSDWLANFTQGDYTYQYEATYRAAENTYRYVSLLCNYDGVNNYNTVDIRFRGDGYNQVRRGDSWIHYSDDEVPMGDTGDEGMAAKVFGIEYDENEYALKDRTFTVRVEMIKDKGPRVYVDGVFVSEMIKNEENWGDIPASAICFKTSTKLRSDIDNIMVWAGVGCEPDLSVLVEEEEPAPAETEAPAAEAPAPEPPAPKPVPSPEEMEASRAQLAGVSSNLQAVEVSAPQPLAAPQTADMTAAVIIMAAASLSAAVVIGRRSR